MQINKSKNKSLKIVTSAGIFLFMLVISLFVFPLSAIHVHVVIGRIATNFLFFYPQMVMLYYGLVSTGDYSKLILSGTASRIIAGIGWIIISFVFGYFFHRTKFRYKILLTLPIAIIIVLIYSYLFYFLGIGIYLEGP